MPNFVNGVMPKGFTGCPKCGGCSWVGTIMLGGSPALPSSERITEVVGADGKSVAAPCAISGCALMTGQAKHVRDIPPSTGTSGELQAALREATAIGIANLFAYCGAYESLTPHKRKQWDRLAELARLADAPAAPPTMAASEVPELATVLREEADQMDDRQARTRSLLRMAADTIARAPVSTAGTTGGERK